MNGIEQRVKRVLTSRVEGFLLEKLAGEETDKLQEARQREKQATMRALARAAASGESKDPSSTVTPQGLESMMDDEDCPVCTKILNALADMPEPRRTKGVAEYGEFRRAIEESEEAAIEVVEDSEVLPDAMASLREVEI